jgi:ectoine hydroxylase-related dioxygenase (phytanoyl-CoA dioxygenase family)
MAQWPLVVGSLSTNASLISGMWFDKLPEANWRVPWHQDVHIPIRPFTAPGWDSWSIKGQLPMVIAPEPWSSRRVALRLHLDDCGVEQGPLQIIPDSHHYGRLNQAAMDALVEKGPIITITAKAGEVLLLHPLLVHRSAAAVVPSHRRVIHVEWCDAPLPPGEIWLDASHE